MESTAGISRRGRRAFNDSLAAAEFSFSTYVRPFISKGTSAPAATGALEAGGSTLYHHAVEEALWALFGGPAAYASDTFTDQFNTSATGAHINLNESNVSTLGPDAGANIYFRIGDDNKITYKLTGAVLNEATINFDIDGIAQIDWSGMASEVSEVASFPAATINEAYSATTNFIRNRLTTLAINVGTVKAPVIGGSPVVGGVGYSTAPTVAFSAPGTSGGTTATGLAIIKSGKVDKIIITHPGNGYLAGDTITCTLTGGGSSQAATAVTGLNTTMDPTGLGVSLQKTYSLTLTGGSVSLSNNVTYTTPEELGIVNVPVGHVTGSRAVSGSFTCYLAEDTTTVNASKDFFDDMTGMTTVTSNKFDLTFAVGGAAGTPRMEIHCPQAHVDIPTHSIEDLISLETTFNALPSSLDVADDADLTYVGKAY
jgi:hypothetical protein